jgi:hypothetical protein
MAESIDIGQNYSLAILLKYAAEVVTEEGNTYYKFPYWFQLHPGNFEFTIHRNLPEDLSQFITKAGLGGPNPRPKEPEL